MLSCSMPLGSVVSGMRSDLLRAARCLHDAVRCSSDSGLLHDAQGAAFGFELSRWLTTRTRILP